MRNWTGYGRTQRAPTREYLYPPKEIREDTKVRRAWLAAKVAELVAQGREAKITGIGTMQLVSVKIVREVAMVDQLRGLCQACGGEWAIVGASISHHGYTRPGGGWQTGSCYGARHQPLEESCEVTAQLAVVLARHRTEQLSRLQQLRGGRMAHLTLIEEFFNRERWRTEQRAVTITPIDARWARAVEIEIVKAESNIRHIESDLRIVTQRVTDWHAGKFAHSTQLVKVAK